ncbi:MAG TPA: hypothetical protein VNA14_03515 [Mycobacteriales bacterium]|nr:hypothetical protein [Mycobacteriales bacterium]
MTTSDGAARGAIEVLFDELCLRWVREADVVVQQTGSLPATLVLLPRDKSVDEVAIRLEGLRGNLLERADALVAELRPQTDPHDPAGLVLMIEARLGVAGGAADPGAAHSGQGTDGAVVYVSLGHAALRRATALRVRRSPDGTTSLERTDVEAPVEHFAWLDALLSSG